MPTASLRLRTAKRYFGLGEEELAGLKRNDPRKLAMARLIRQRTSVPNRWLAQALAVGHASSVSPYGLRGGGGATEAGLEAFCAKEAMPK